MSAVTDLLENAFKDAGFNSVTVWRTEEDYRAYEDGGVLIHPNSIERTFGDDFNTILAAQYLCLHFKTYIKEGFLDKAKAFEGVIFDSLEALKAVGYEVERIEYREPTNERSYGGYMHRLTLKPKASAHPVEL